MMTWLKNLFNRSKSSFRYVVYLRGNREAIRLRTGKGLLQLYRRLKALVDNGANPQVLQSPCLDNNSKQVTSLSQAIVRAEDVTDAHDVEVELLSGAAREWYTTCVKHEWLDVEEKLINKFSILNWADVAACVAFVGAMCVSNEVAAAVAIMAGMIFNTLQQWIHCKICSNAMEWHAVKNRKRAETLKLSVTARCLATGVMSTVVAAACTWAAYAGFGMVYALINSLICFAIFFWYLPESEEWYKLVRSSR